MDAGLRLVAIEEHDTVPWNALGDAMEDVGGGEFRLRIAPERLPATYTLQAIKPGSPDDASSGDEPVEHTASSSTPPGHLSDQPQWFAAVRPRSAKSTFPS